MSGRTRLPRPRRVPVPSVPAQQTARFVAAVPDHELRAQIASALRRTADSLERFQDRYLECNDRLRSIEGHLGRLGEIEGHLGALTTACGKRRKKRSRKKRT